MVRCFLCMSWYAGFGDLWRGTRKVLEKNCHKGVHRFQGAGGHLPQSIAERFLTRHCGGKVNFQGSRGPCCVGSASRFISFGCCFLKLCNWTKFWHAVCVAVKLPTCLTVSLVQLQGYSQGTGFGGWCPLPDNRNPTRHFTHKGAREASGTHT